MAVSGFKLEFDGVGGGYFSRSNRRSGRIYRSRERFAPCLQLYFSRRSARRDARDRFVMDGGNRAQLARSRSRGDYARRRALQSTGRTRAALRKAKEKSAYVERRGILS